MRDGVVKYSRGALVTSWKSSCYHPLLTHLYLVILPVHHSSEGTEASWLQEYLQLLNPSSTFNSCLLGDASLVSSTARYTYDLTFCFQIV
jgi:hypothetical protein